MRDPVISANKENKTSFPLPSLLTLGMGLWFWVLFFPGNLSFDSIYQYGQAVTGNYTDITPPIMSAVVALILKVGGDIQSITLLQVIAGVFGFRSLVINIMSGFGINKQILDYISVLLLALFFAPVSPLAFYLMTFWKDSWLFILLLWVSAFLVRLYVDTSLSHRDFVAIGAAVSSLFAFVILVRYNALVVFPFFVFAFWMVFKQKRESMTLFVFLVVFSIVTSQGINALQYKLLNIKRFYPTQGVMALDLVGILVINPELKKEFPYVSENLHPNYQELYVFGQDYPFYGGTDSILDIMVRGEKNQELTDEYYRAITRYPIQLSQVKLKAFYEVIRPDMPHNPMYFSGIDKNTFGLAQNKIMKYKRNDYKSLAKLGIKDTPLRWISGVSMVWVVIGLVELSLSCIIWWRKNKQALFWAAMLLLPLSYCGSYLMASIDVDYRFLYPTVLLIQLYSASFILGLAIFLGRKIFKNRV